MVAKVQYGELARYGINNLNDMASNIMQKINEGNITNIDDLLSVIYEKNYEMGSLPCYFTQIIDEIFNNYDLCDIYNILTKYGFDIQNKPSIETVHIILSQNEMKQYLEYIYNTINNNTLLTNKEKMITLLNEVGKQNNLDFTKDLQNKKNKIGE